MTSVPPAAPTTVFSVLRERVRRGQLILGIGGLAATLGAVLAAPLVVALIPWAQKGRSPALMIVLHAIVSRLWIYAVLPALWWVVVRWIVGLRPWRTAIWSAVVGESFYLLLDWVGGSLGNLLRHPAVIAIRLLTLG